MKKQRKPIKLMKKSHSIILFAVCAMVLIGAVAAMIYLGGDMI